jgi:hypothetical protein
VPHERTNLQRVKEISIFYFGDSASLFLVPSHRGRENREQQIALLRRWVEESLPMRGFNTFTFSAYSVSLL